MTGSQLNTPTAIPTEYKGVRFKSRMEAQCAALFDKLAWEWEYEPFSLMLPSGLTYIPDFYIENPIHGIVECRGYESPRGIRQIDEFAALCECPDRPGFDLPNGEPLHDYIVIGPRLATHYCTAYPWRRRAICAKPSEREDYQFSVLNLSLCQCGWTADLRSWCPNCDSHATAALIVTVIKGKIFANGVPVEDFLA